MATRFYGAAEIRGSRTMKNFLVRQQAIDDGHLCNYRAVIPQKNGMECPSSLFLPYIWAPTM